MTRINVQCRLPPRGPQTNLPPNMILLAPAKSRSVKILSCPASRSGSCSPGGSRAAWDPASTRMDSSSIPSAPECPAMPLEWGQPAPGLLSPSSLNFGFRGWPKRARSRLHQPDPCPWAPGQRLLGTLWKDSAVRILRQHSRRRLRYAEHDPAGCGELCSWRQR